MLKTIATILVLAMSVPAYPFSFKGAMDNRDGFPPVPGFTAQSLAWATGGSPGGGMRLEWQAENESVPGLWTYRYRLLRGASKRKGFAYFDIETAADFGAANLKAASVLAATDRSGLPIPSGLASVAVSGPFSFTAQHDFNNPQVTEASFATALSKLELSHYSGDPGRAPAGVPGGAASATPSQGPVARPFYGLRVTFPGSFTDLAYEAVEWEFSVVADRVPMWGSFFGWGDQTFVSPFWYANVYNEGLDGAPRPALPPAESTDGAAPYRGWILVPGALPRVSATVPADGAVDASRNLTVSAFLNNPVDPLSVGSAALAVAGVEGAVSYHAGANALQFVPALPFAPGASYRATAGAGLRDLAGNALPVTSFSFTVAFGAPSFPDGILVPGGTATTVADALAGLRIAVGLDPATAETLLHGDLAPLGPDRLPRPDGLIDIADALVLLQKAVGILSW